MPEGETVAVGTPIITVDDGDAAPRRRRRRPRPPTRGVRRPAARRPGPGGPGESAVGTPAAEQAVEPGADRRSGAGRPHLGAGRLRTADHRGHPPSAQGRDPRRRLGRGGPAGGAAVDVDRAGRRCRSRRSRRPPRLPPAYTVGAGADGAGVRVLAKPPVRKLAKDLGVDLDHGGTVRRGRHRHPGRRRAAAAGAGSRSGRRTGVRPGSRVSGRPGSRSRACAR